MPAADISVVRALSIRPELPPARMYGNTQMPKLASLQARLVSTLRPLVGEPDGGLCRLAQELARLPDALIEFPPGLLDELRAWTGVPEPTPHVVSVDATMPCMGAACDPWVEALVDAAVRMRHQEHAGQTRVGVGVFTTPSRQRAIVVVQRRVLALAPLPTQVALQAGLRLNGRLLAGHTHPAVEFVDPKGGMHILAPRVDGTDFTTHVPCNAGPGRYQVEVLTEGSAGVEVAANFPLWCGQPRPTSALLVSLERLQPGVHPRDVEGVLAHAVQEARRAHNLPALQWHRGLAAVARAHSQDMRQGQFVAHRSTRTGEAPERLRAANIEASVVRENVALGHGPYGIHEGLMASPGHRRNILATDVTMFGIGVVLDTRETPPAVLVTEVFADRLLGG